MIKIGCHLSSAGGFTAMAQTALKIGADTFQYFTRNPRGGTAKAIDKSDVENFLNISAQNKIAPIVAHAPYTLNLCSAAEHIREFSKNMFADDLLRTEFIPNSYYNFHPGSHTGQGTDVGIKQISDVLNMMLKPKQTTTVLLETMVGKGSEIGGTFEEIKKIIDKVELKNKMGVCLDTCHIFDGGYDIRNDLEGVLDDFDKVIGLQNLKFIHLNDSKNPCGSKKDRHEQIGKGSLGLETMVKIINHPALKNLPFILETPQENLEGYAEEMALLNKLSE